jgi:hypothetical protein|nr:MAG TPA: hypothetical protein [Caudoviricetes sp.]
MAKKTTVYTKQRNRIMRYINTLKRKGYKVELNIPTERQIRQSGVSGTELGKLSRELKKITPKTLKSIAKEVERVEKVTKDYPTSIQMGSSYSLTVIDNLRAELSKYKTEIKDKILVLINQLITQQGAEDVAYALNNMNENFFTSLYRAHFDSNSAIQNFSTALIENLPEASEQYKKDLMDAFENEELGYTIED